MISWLWGSSPFSTEILKSNVYKNTHTIKCWVEFTCTDIFQDKPYLKHHMLITRPSIRNIGDNFTLLANIFIAECWAIKWSAALE